MNITLDEPLGKPKKTVLQQIQGQLESQFPPLRQIQEMQDLVKQYSAAYELEKLIQGWVFSRHLGKFN